MRKLVLGTCAVALLISAQTAAAQVAWGVSAGALLPQGNASNFTSSGYNVNGLASIKPPALPVGLRFEVGYGALSGKNSGPDFKIISGVANAIIEKAAVMPTKPYIIAGLGIYHSKVDVSGAPTSNDLGLNGGVGIKFALSGLGAFAEARYQTIMTSGTSTNMIPLTFGITF